MFVTLNTDLRLMRVPSSHHSFSFCHSGCYRAASIHDSDKLLSSSRSQMKNSTLIFQNRTRFISFALDELEHVETPNSSHDKKAHEINGNYGKFIFFFCCCQNKSSGLLKMCTISVVISLSRFFNARYLDGLYGSAGCFQREIMPSFWLLYNDALRTSFPANISEYGHKRNTLNVL